MKNVLLWIWQLPQNLLGLAVLLFNKVSSGCVEVKYIDNIKYYLVKHVNNCGVSLGNYIFLILIDLLQRKQYIMNGAIKSSH